MMGVDHVCLRNLKERKTRNLNPISIDIFILF